MRKVLWFILGAMFLMPGLAGSYTIAPLKPLHERLTWMTERCADVDSPGAGRMVPGSLAEDTRIVCSFDQFGLRATKKLVSRRPWKLDPLETAARWGDDPGNATRRLGSTTSYGIKLKWLCDKKDYSGLTIYQAGVMCSGHYGKLGFFHAMMSSDDDSALSLNLISGQQAQANTRNKILAWAAFSYEVAKGSQPLDDGICVTFRDNPQYAALRDSFSDRLDKGMADCTGPASTWSVRDFFTFLCANPIAGRECDVVPGDRDTEARRNARGSLLHMIQDSYSQSHVARPPLEQVPRGRSPYAIIACTAPTSYAYYSEENRKNHAKSDAYPWIDTASCGEGLIADPVSAGATMLLMLRNKVPTGNFIRYLEERVFRLA